MMENNICLGEHGLESGSVCWLFLSKKKRTCEKKKLLERSRVKIKTKHQVRNAKSKKIGLVTFHHGAHFVI
jgi:hypothetical protein